MLTILADDLTGALDAAAPFAGRGLSTMVALGIEGMGPALKEAPEVLAVSLGCRDGLEEDARQLTVKALSALPAGTKLFKKIDSRLKGHIAAELEMMRFRRALVAPAIPDFGRIVENGSVCGFGVSAPIPVAARLGRHAADAIIPDVASQGEMRAALAGADEAGVDLLVGARGLGEALAEAMTGRDAPSTVRIGQGRGLFVIGSRDPITLAQIEALRAAGLADRIAAPNGVPEEVPSRDGRVTLVQATPGDEPCAPLEVSDRLAEGVVPGLTAPAETLLLCGGATAEAVMRRMGVTHMRLLGECAPGLGVGEVDGRRIITKSGGVGRVDTLKDIAESILGMTV